jgi:hypothetical protein
VKFKISRPRRLSAALPFPGHVSAPLNLSPFHVLIFFVERGNETLHDVNTRALSFILSATSIEREERVRAPSGLRNKLLSIILYSLKLLVLQLDTIPEKRLHHGGHCSIFRFQEEEEGV